MKHKMRVFAVALLVMLSISAFLSACTPEGEKERMRLSAPHNVYAANGIIYWDEVENAVGYTICFYGDEYDTGGMQLRPAFFD